ncbi:hypothetical protein CCR75_002353 [Bremia lactucae]|uniref:BZIP domain-containing protein n=1 Tax=Bremia lactucae TaxID=4779 RepID=A0A976FMU2_BRELC|nr:hypothetical protein CCR75_002353 [Bremia lactucae]
MIDKDWHLGANASDEDVFRDNLNQQNESVVSVRSESSLFESPNVVLNAHHSVDRNCQICGKDPRLYSSKTGSQLVATDHLRKSHIKRLTTTASKWTRVAFEEISDRTQLPNTGAIQLRRQKNRECMRKARHRQQEELHAMKKTVASLEKQYAHLCLRATACTDDVACQTLSNCRTATNYAQALELVKRLGAENLYLKAEIQQQATWKLHLFRILDSCLTTDTPQWSLQPQQPALSGIEALHLHQLDQYEAAQTFGFRPLTELDLTRVILENKQTLSRVQHKLFFPNVDKEGWRIKRRQLFGWDILQKVEKSVMECVFTKTFTGLRVVPLMQKTWANDMRLDQFQKVKGETCRLEVLQRINANAYVLGRDVTSPTTDISTFRSVFVRFLNETKRMYTSSTENVLTYVDTTAPSVPISFDTDSKAIRLEVTGYVLGTQSVDSAQRETNDRLQWAHLSLSIEFLNVVNLATGEEYQQLRWTGRTDYRGEEHAHRNAGDTLQGLLRWEMLTIAPALNLVSL